ncbi:MAG: CotH kinase family protein [Saprospiraceae bacterium]
MKNTLLILLAFLCSNSYLIAQEQANFYATDKVQNIEIKFEDDDWQYILDSLRTNGNGLLLAEVTINGEKYPDAGVRFRGSSSFQTGSPRNALFIKLNYIKKKQNHQGHKKLKLSNSLRDPSMIREVLGYEIARDYMPAPQANYARTYINNQYYGLFVNVEPIADEFLERNFDNDNGSFFKANPQKDFNSSRCSAEAITALNYANNTSCYLNNFEIESKEGWDDLIEMTNVLSNHSERIERVLDVDRTLWMLAFNNVVANLSSYSGQTSQNYYLYRDTLSGQFTPILWDLNLSFGGFKNTGDGSDLKLRDLMNLDPLLHANNPDKPLISKLLANAEYKNIYLNHIRVIIKDWFRSNRYAMRAQELQQLIRVPLTNTQDWGYSINDFNKSLISTIGKRSRIPGIQELMEKRSNFLYAHKALSVLPPKVTEVKVLGRKKLSNQKKRSFTVQATVERRPKNVTIFYRFDAKSPFMEKEMYDNGQQQDGAANDGVYGAKITPPAGKDSVEYYLYTRNPKAASFHPNSYMYERLSASLESVNK